MFVKNYDIIRKLALLSYPYGSFVYLSEELSTMYGTIIGTNGGELKRINCSNDRNSRFLNESDRPYMFDCCNIAANGSMDIVLGNGTTPATYNDFKLENKITSNWTRISANRVNDNTVASSKAIITYTLSAQTPLSISEIGIECKLATGTTTTGSNPVLILREVLDEPFVVTTGEVFTVTFTFEFDREVPTVSMSLN